MNSTYWLNRIMSTMYTNGTDEFWVGFQGLRP